MAAIGSPDHPARVAIIGAGPAGFYAAGHLLSQTRHTVEVDMFDKLPVPYGLVRSGVAPDHQKIKNVTRIYAKTAKRPGFRFFGHVQYGEQLHLADLKQHYHQVCFTTGAQVDRRLGIPGEDLNRSYSATDFVAWYNGHPEYRDLSFDLSHECVAVVGVGNVAVDVCRILCRTMDELRKTDMADYALEALAESKVRQVIMLGRRGPAQAAFTNPEAKELGQLPGADIHVKPEEATLDPVSAAWLEESGNRLTVKKVGLIEAFSQCAPTGKPKCLTIRFLVSPVALHDDGHGGVGGMRLVHNALEATGDGRTRPQATDQFEELPAHVVFRSVGYRGVPLADLPFNESWGVIPSEKGRVTDLEAEAPLRGLYVAGWIKRGPTGVIGTNKPDALETVKCMLDDLDNQACYRPAHTDPLDIEKLIRARQPNVIDWSDWERLDAAEVAAGTPQGRPRVKFVCAEDMLAALASTTA